MSGGNELARLRWTLAELKRRDVPQDVIDAIRADLAAHYQGRLRTTITARHRLSTRQQKRLAAARNANEFRALRDELVSAEQICGPRRLQSFAICRAIPRRRQHRPGITRRAPRAGPNDPAADSRTRPSGNRAGSRKTLSTDNGNNDTDATITPVPPCRQENEGGPPW